ncbi:hypothetical protein, partial [Thermobacillus sp. ZCTH02-B1]|uniref:hypothetical protein n=1 Tax=Thermobacillus sp. ZCTH02-B1 TaxID=1858795 RepID=UPI0025EE749B
ATWLWKSGPHLKQVGFLLVILANTIKQTPTFHLKHGSLSSVCRALAVARARFFAPEPVRVSSLLAKKFGTTFRK